MTAESRSGGHRTYGRADLTRLNHIRRCRDCDIPLERIRDLVALSDGGKPCAETAAFFESQRTNIHARIEALKDLDMMLSLQLQSCKAGCMPSGDPCKIFDELQH